MNIFFSRAKIEPDLEDLHSTSNERFFQVREIDLFMDDLLTSSLYLMRVRAS